MKKSEIQIGETYHARVSGNRTLIRILSESPFGGWNATNLDTGRTIRIKTAARLHPNTLLHYLASSTTQSK